MGFRYVLLVTIFFSEVFYVSADYSSLVYDSCKSTGNGEPIGHLDRLGCQRPPTGSADEYLTAPSPKQLWENNVKPYKPAILRNGLAGSVALSAWSDEYLISNYGDQDVLIEKKYEDRRSIPKRMTISEFLAHYHKENWYVVSMLPNAMRTDIRVPKPLMCSTFRKNLAELNLWIGTNGTRSVLHHDADNILHCVVSGSKDWVLFHPMHKPKLDMVLKSENRASGFSHLNVDKIDYNIHPEVWDVPWDYATLKSGDCLYLPARYLHQVTSYERTISVTFLFYPEGKFSDENCKDVDYDIHQSLKDAFVYWTLGKGQETVDMGYMNPEVIKKLFLLVLEMIGEAQMDFKTYLYISGAVNEDSLNAEYFQIFDNFRKFDCNDDNVITVEEMENCDIETWKSWCRALETPHGPKKSDLYKNHKLTSYTTEFAPKPAPNNLDSSYGLIFLKFVIRALGENDEITYTEFAKWIKVQNGTVAGAFMIFDKDFDGIITFEEITNSPAKRLRDFNKLYYSIKGTNITGGGIYVEEMESKSLKYLDDLSSIPASAMTKLEKTEYKDQKRILKLFFETINDLTSTKKYVDEITFTNFAKQSEIMNLFEPNATDLSFFFKILDRGNKGYISHLDIEYYIADEKVYLFEQSDATYADQIENELATPCQFIVKMLSVMDMVDKLLLSGEEISKAGDKQQRVLSIAESQTLERTEL